MSDIEVRDIRPDEHDRAGDIVVAAYRALTDHVVSAEYEDELRDVTKRASGSEVLVAVRDGQVIGCVTFVPDFRSPWAEGLKEGESSIRMLGVDPPSQGLGAGRLLLEACVARAEALKSTALCLHSTPWMQLAQEMYRRTGFAREPERDALPVPDVPLIAYRLDLPRT